jgi:hypothetical protein
VIWTLAVLVALPAFAADGAMELPLTRRNALPAMAQAGPALMSSSLSVLIGSTILSCDARQK